MSEEAFIGAEEPDPRLTTVISPAPHSGCVNGTQVEFIH